MKKIIGFSAVIALIFISISSCNKVREALFPGIEVDLPAFQFVIPPIPIVATSEASLGSYTLQFNLDSIIRANTNGVFGVGAVASVKVKEMTISIPNADQDNKLSSFESARFTLYSNTKSEPAEIINVIFLDTDQNSKTVKPVNSPELKGYLTGNQLTFTLYGKNRAATTKPLTFNVVTKLTAK